MKERSLFFPLALIASGVIWLLVVMGNIPAENLWALARAWPILLIGAGLGLIIRSFWAPGRMVIDVLMIGVMVLSVVFAPRLGLAPPHGWGMAGFVGGGEPGSGKIITVAREVDSFDSISISYPAEVVIRQGEAELVKIEAEDNLVPQLSSNVESGKLVIKNDEPNWGKRINPTKLVRITITVKDLKSFDFSSAGTARIEKLSTDALNINMSGAGELTIEQLQTKLLDCNLSGAGSITAAGTAETLTLNISGVGSFHGGDLVSQDADARISGAGSATVNASQRLDATISGTGSVRYHGRPTVSKTISGLGSVESISE